MPFPGDDARCRGRGQVAAGARAGPGRWRGAGPRGRCPRGAERCLRRCAMAGTGTGARWVPLLALCLATAVLPDRTGERLHVCKEVPAPGDGGGGVEGGRTGNPPPRPR